MAGISERLTTGLLIGAVASAAPAAAYEVRRQDSLLDRVLNPKLNGFGLPPAGIPGLTATLTIHLKDSGVDDPFIFPENAPPLVGERVRITCNIRLIDEKE